MGGGGVGWGGGGGDLERNDYFFGSKKYWFLRMTPDG